MGLILFGILSIISCNNDDDRQINPMDQNRVLLLKIDFEANTFEEGREFVFSTNKDFDISSEYVSPGDFGSIDLLYKGTQQKLFSGTIVWSGLGKIDFPEKFIQPEDFNRLNEPLPMPDVSEFKKVMYDEHAFYPENIEYQKIWESIADLKLVKEYRRNNPETKINILLYTPAVGIMDPAEADWIMVIKN